ncbi:MAG: inorganic diphosphatase [Candidatus Woesearchaeota archaeon]
MDPWHDVSRGSNAPTIIQAIIEAPKNSSLKYEIDKETGMLRLDRALYSAVHYPGNYGFIPQTYWEDEDPLDVVVLHEQPIHPLTIVEVRPIGVMRMIDGGESDDKILAVLKDDPRYEQTQDVEDIASHTLKELKNFFENYKQLEGKTVQITKIEGKQAAQETIQQASKQYDEKFS